MFHELAQEDRPPNLKISRTKPIKVEGRCITVVYTWRGQAKRLISARKARKNEQKSYENAVQEGLKKSKTDWERLDKMTDEDIVLMALPSSAKAL